MVIPSELACNVDKSLLSIFGFPNTTSSIISSINCFSLKLFGSLSDNGEFKDDIFS